MLLLLNSLAGGAMGAAAEPRKKWMKRQSGQYNSISHAELMRLKAKRAATYQSNARLDDFLKLWK